MGDVSTRGGTRHYKPTPRGSADRSDRRRTAKCPLEEVRDLASYTLQPALATVPGVAQVGVQGGQTEEYRVVVDLAKLQALKLTVTDESTLAIAIISGLCFQLPLVLLVLPALLRAVRKG